MKTLKKILIELLLPFTLSWLLMSALVDFVAIPTVFKNISNLEEAGKIGMTVFHRFNFFEILLGAGILVGTISKEKKAPWQIVLGCALFVLSLFYTFYMTPIIAEAGIKIHQISSTDPQYQVLQMQHTTYHNLYRSLDSAKLIALLIFAIQTLRINILNREGL
jgi:hypothetical protein